MIELKFHAAYDFELAKFRVSVSGPIAIEQIMAPDEFLAFAASDKEMVIGGTAIRFEGDSDRIQERSVREYFKKVAASYVQYRDKLMLTKLELDLAAAGGCQTPGCTHQHDQTMFFHQRCHPHAHVEVSYTAGSGKLVIACVQCQRVIAEVAVRGYEPK